MPRKYTRNSEKSDLDPVSLLEAIKEIKNKKKSITYASGLYNIPKSSLFRYLGKINQEFPEFSNVSDQRLLEFIRSITKLSGKKLVMFLYQFILLIIISY